MCKFSYIHAYSVTAIRHLKVPISNGHFHFLTISVKKVYQNTDTGTDTGTENSVNTGTDTRYFDNSVLILIIGTFEITSTGTGNRYSSRVLTKGLVLPNTVLALL